MPSVRHAFLLGCLAVITPLLPAANAPVTVEIGRKSAVTEIASLREKAERGNSIAQYNLGLTYAEGRQVPVDLPEALAWLSIAAESGSTGKALEDLIGRMNPAQIAEGRRRLDAIRLANPILQPPAAAPTPAFPAGGTVAGENNNLVVGRTLRIP